MSSSISIDATDSLSLSSITGAEAATPTTFLCLPDLLLLGYNIELFGKNNFIIQGVPADVLSGNEKHSAELLLEQYKHFSSELKFNQRQKLIHCLARQQAVKAGQSLTDKEMRILVEELFNCDMPSVAPNGNPVFVEFNDEQLLKMFGR